MAARSAGVTGPSRDAGGRTSVFCTTVGTPFSSSTETSASPTPSAWIAVAVSKVGFGRNDAAAARSPFCSAGV